LSGAHPVTMHVTTALGEHRRRSVATTQVPVRAQVRALRAGPRLGRPPLG
jgi:hypothetical protein